jgi:quercetin dioxygenase-like cupin family protein
MRRHHAIVVASLLGIAASVAPQAAGAQSAAPANPPALQWGPAPAVFEPGAQMAVLQGDPSKAGEEFTVRLRLPSGYKIAPHTHPTAENITVIEGTFLVGMGSTFDKAKMMTLPRGAFASAPAQHPHYAEARGATVVQVHAIGPFALTYVNPADAPVALRSQR